MMAGGTSLHRLGVEAKKKVGLLEARIERARKVVTTMHNGMTECGCDLEVNSLCELAQILDVLCNPERDGG